jgi:hypothetical protein
MFKFLTMKGDDWLFLLSSSLFMLMNEIVKAVTERKMNQCTNMMKGDEG